MAGPLSGQKIAAVFGHCFPGDSHAIVYSHNGVSYTIPWREVASLELGPADRLKLPGNPTSAGPLEYLMQRLLAPEDGCPWDREQTPMSLLRYLLDESYEAAEALVAGDPEAFQDELGDVLFQILFQSALIPSSNFGKIVQFQVEKLVRRHPHVFAGEQRRAADAANQRWESLKTLDRQRHDDAQWAYPSLIWAKRQSKRGIIPQSPVFRAIEASLQVYISNTPGTLEEILADAAWAVADMGAQHNMDAEWALWKRLAYARQNKDLL
jgi:NTP pyrophosphatase (non-canonical NTP hydrolase)